MTKICHICQGNGEIDITCSSCNGCGEYFDGEKICQCEDCHGSGVQEDQSCPHCNGFGRLDEVS